MRISDWSSDVCSSDLQWSGGLIRHNIHKEDVRFDAESLGNLVKPIDTYAVLSPLQSAHISPVDSSDIGQSLLREPAGRSQQPQVLCKIISARHRTRWSRLSSYAPRSILFIRNRWALPPASDGD